MQNSFQCYADELQAKLPTNYAASPGGIIGRLVTLVAALQSGDINAIFNAIADLLREIAGSGQSASDALKAAGMDWSWVKDLILKILPIILQNL
jgi:hypothetical protein